jgi:glutamate dehydrogenase/leucine dehydrogenase
MTYKNALAGLNYGGGKGVIWLQPNQTKTPELVKAMGKRIALLKGSYFTATDVGSTSADMKLMRGESPYVSALAPEDGGLGCSAILTGYGVYLGMKASAKVRFGTDSLEGRTIAIQGTGKVASHMMGYLQHEGCKVIVTDAYAPALEAFLKAYPMAEAVAPEAIWQVKADILSPNAIGGSITPEVVQHTEATIIAGGANNPLSEASVADLLQQRGIAFAPDFAINSGGVITLSAELAGQTFDEAKAQTAGIYDTTLRIFEKAEADKTNTLQAAIAVAQARIDSAQHTKQVVVAV